MCFQPDSVRVQPGNGTWAKRVLHVSAPCFLPAVRERSLSLSAELPHLPPALCWALYTGAPGLLTFMSHEVARRLRALALLLGSPYQALALQVQRE